MRIEWLPTALASARRFMTDQAGMCAIGIAVAEDAVLAEMRQAIELHLAGLREDGQPIPHPSTVAATVITLDIA